MRKFWGDDRKASDISSRKIDDYIEKRLEAKNRAGEPMSNATVNRERAVLRMFFCDRLNVPRLIGPVKVTESHPGLFRRLA